MGGRRPRTRSSSGSRRRPAAPPARSARRSTAELSDEQRARLRAACGNDDALLDRVAPYHALLREDLRGDPLVFLPGSLFVTQALDRRASGTYYTPRELAEEVVRYALDPVAYDPGPAQEPDPAKWRLKPAAELLELKIADIAMGSGAFLVAACRYLAARLLEAWSRATRDGADAGSPATRCRPTRSSARRSPTASSPSAACTASTRTRWPSRWPSSRSG